MNGTWTNIDSDGHSIFSKPGTSILTELANLIEHLIANGTDSLVVCGTTGESPTLNPQKKKEILFKFAIETVNKRIPVIAGTGTFSTTETVKLTRMAEQVGADGIMLVTPYYNKPDQKGMYAHFTHVAGETDCQSCCTIFQGDQLSICFRKR